MQCKNIGLEDRQSNPPSRIPPIEAKNPEAPAYEKRSGSDPIAGTNFPEDSHAFFFTVKHNDALTRCLDN
jgi:hypothetical protein